jgi:uncharacterized protein YdhG (YjbR/CyaY superfamily)
MAERKTGRTSTKSTTKAAFTDDERAAMREHAREMKAAKVGADAESDVRQKIAEMTEPDRGMAQRLHEIIKANAPELEPRTWYGMPAYAKGGNVVCFFQPRAKFKARYAMLGFSDKANLDEGTMWPTYYALTELTADNEAKITALITQAVR